MKCHNAVILNGFKQHNKGIKMSTSNSDSKAELRRCASSWWHPYIVRDEMTFREIVSIIFKELVERRSLVMFTTKYKYIRDHVPSDMSVILLHHLMLVRGNAALEIFTYLENDGYDFEKFVNIREDNTLMTPLMIGASCGNILLVKKLLKYNPHVNEIDCDGNTAMIHATKSDYGRDKLGMIKLLLSIEKLDINVRNNDGLSALSYTADIRYRRKDDTQNCKDKVEIIKTLLDHGADPNGDPEPFIFKVMMKHADTQVVRLLAKHGLDPNVMSTDLYPGHTPLTLAIRRNRTEIAMILINEARASIYLPDVNGKRPLDYIKNKPNGRFRSAYWIKYDTHPKTIDILTNVLNVLTEENLEETYQGIHGIVCIYANPEGSAIKREKLKTYINKLDEDMKLEITGILPLPIEEEIVDHL